MMHATHGGMMMAADGSTIALAPMAGVWR